MNILFNIRFSYKFESLPLLKLVHFILFREQWKVIDPITSFKEKILNAELVTSDELKKIDVEVKQEVDDAVKLAKSDAEIGMEELTADIYSKPLEKYIRGVTPFNALTHNTVTDKVYF